jgi:hypothetical protein
MARDVIERELIRGKAGRVHFTVATGSDDADIRRLLRENSMPGRISISFEREPNYFADANLPGESKQTIVARDGGQVICVGNCTIRQRFVNGKPAAVGYLGGLRLKASHAGRFEILRQGYEFFHQLQAARPADFYFTSIASDNERARTLLERGLPGMPSYEFIGEFVTVLLPAKRGHPGTDFVEIKDSPAGPLADLLNYYNREQQLAPVWSEDELAALRPLGLQPHDYRLIGDSRRIVAIAALWDQRVFKQTVIRGYAPSLKWARPIFNLVARLAGGTKLPAVGKVLSNAFVAHLAYSQDKPDTMIHLISALRWAAAQRGIELLTLGFAADDPRMALIRREFHGREYQSRLYAVRWPGCGGSAKDLNGRWAAPEVALL